jgi:hypothetical protein
MSSVRGVWLTSDPSRGLIDSWPKRGTIVNDRKAWKLLDSDVIMWGRSARRDDDRLLAELSQLRDVIEPAAANQDFHLHLLRASGHCARP